MPSKLRETPYKKDRWYETKGHIFQLITNLKESQVKMKTSSKLKEFEGVCRELIRSTKDEALDIIDRECLIDDNIIG